MIATEFMIQSAPEPDYEIYRTKGGYPVNHVRTRVWDTGGIVIGILLIYYSTEFSHLVLKK